MEKAAHDSWGCVSCGAPAPDDVLTCGCWTAVASRALPGKEPSTVRLERRRVLTRRQGKMMALHSLIETRLLNVNPDDQDVVLEPEDWSLIMMALTHYAGRSGDVFRTEVGLVGEKPSSFPADKA